MSKFLNAEVEKQLKEALDAMVDHVTIVFFGGKAYQNSDLVEQLLKEIVPLSGKLTLKVRDFDKDQKEAESYGVVRAPTFVLLDKDNNFKGVRFSGVPAGHEINSFITGLIDMSSPNNTSYFDDETVAKIKAIDKELQFKVFVTVSCPYCPDAVINAHRMAIINPLIKADMIEAQTFYEESQKYKISGVPDTYINSKVHYVGALPIKNILTEVAKV